MNRIVLMLLLSGVWTAAAWAGPPCETCQPCTHCGGCTTCQKDYSCQTCPDNSCKECKSFCSCEERLVTVYECVCEDICIPGRGGECAQIKTVKRLVSKQIRIRVPVKRHMVVNKASACGDCGACDSCGVGEMHIVPTSHAQAAEDSQPPKTPGRQVSDKPKPLLDRLWDSLSP